jgi:ubiquinone/menaquinone biosynthesis C-methylase UbiE
MPNFYEKYWKYKDAFLSDFNLKWPVLSGFIPRDRNILVVDFGCGNGEILKEIKKINPALKCIGLDVSNEALRQAKEKNPDVDFFKIEDGEKLPLKDSSIDFVFSSEVIEHIYDTQNAFKELSRILKPGGKALITTPYHGLIKNIILALFYFDDHFNPTGPHIRFFTQKSLYLLLEDNNFKIIKRGYYGRFYPIPHSIYVLVQKKQNI